MYLEHIIYTAAFAVLFGIAYKQVTGRDPIWIMILGSVLPDSDWVLQQLSVYCFGMCSRLTVFHGEFHNVVMLLALPYLVAKIIEKFGYVFEDVYTYCTIGFLLHIIEDTLVYSDGYPILFPISTQTIGIGMNPAYNPDFHGLFMVWVMVVGLILLLGAIIARIFIEGLSWSQVTALYNKTKSLVPQLS